MATSPYGCITAPMATFRTMLSYCPAFQLWVEETDGAIPASGSTRAEFCLDYIRLGGYKAPASGGYVYPSAIIEIPDSVGYEITSQGGGGAVFSGATGILDCTIHRDVPTAYRNDIEGALIDFAGVSTDGVLTGIGAIMSDLTNLDSAIDQFEHYNISLMDGPGFYKDEKAAARGLVMAATIRCSWGVN